MRIKFGRKRGVNDCTTLLLLWAHNQGWSTMKKISLFLGHYQSFLNCFFWVIFVSPVLSKTYSTILDSSLLKMEAKFLNKNSKRKDCSQTTCSFVGNSIMLRHNIPILIKSLLKATCNFQFKFVRARLEERMHIKSPNLATEQKGDPNVLLKTFVLSKTFVEWTKRKSNALAAAAAYSHCLE